MAIKERPVLFKVHEAGCYADGAYGEEHRRDVLHGLVETVASCLGGECDPDEINGLLASLRKPAADDYSDEDEAIDLLNQHTEDGVYWTMHEGDLLLSTEGAGDGI